MLIKHIIEFQLRGPGSPGRTLFLYLVNFMKGYSLSGLFFTAKILQKAICLTYLIGPLYGPKHLQLKFYTIMQDFKRILKFNCK